MKKKTVLIVGGGAAGIMTAMHLSSKYNIIIIEKEKSIGRKLLVAGKGGFNLSNNCNNQNLIQQYTPSSLLKKSLLLFPPKKLQSFLLDLGIETYIGSSGRIFPKKGIKPAKVLAYFKLKLAQNGVKIKLKHQFISLSNNSLKIINPANQIEFLSFDFCVFALGGASWSKTGSDGKWTSAFTLNQLKTTPFQASNCGVNINWNSTFLKHHEGKPLKNISFTVANQTIKGEGLITSYGIEGNAIYPLIGIIREQLNKNKKAILFIDFKPNNSIEDLQKKMKGKNYKSYSKALNLSTLEMAILKTHTSKNNYLSPTKFIHNLKKLKLTISNLRPIEEAISTVGGVHLNSIQSNFSLKHNPQVFVIGEMLDWDAPTGGFLLQACFSMGYSVALNINKQLNNKT